MIGFPGDYLSVNGVKYTGTSKASAPHGIVVLKGAVIKWHTSAGARARTRARRTDATNATKTKVCQNPKGDLVSQSLIIV